MPAHAPTPSPAPAPLGWSLGIRGRDSWREVPLRSPVVTLGGRGSDVVLPGVNGGGEHARLELRGEAAHLRVPGAAQPASLHGVAVRAAALRDGDAFRLGELELTLHRRRATAEAAEAGEHPLG